VPRSSKSKKKVVAILGAGRMGADIALAFARGGWQCHVFENDGSARKRAAAYWKKECTRLNFKTRSKNLNLHSEIDAMPWKSVDLVIEAVFEDLALKHRLLRDIEPRVRPDALITTNTSGLRVRDVVKPLKRQGRSAGLHFSVPAHVMLAVEITRGPKTALRTMKKLIGWMEGFGKVPVVLQRDVPGMLINRIQHAMYREIYHLIDSGIATARDVDRAVRFGFGMRYNILGPVVSRDIHGLPVHLATSRNLYPTLHNGRRPSATLSRLVAQGHHGVRTGRGFYRWNPKTVDKRLDKFTQLLESGYARMKRIGEPTEF
jgi:3-hydroxybutyryl-CoA dehydrogenase